MLRAFTSRRGGIDTQTNKETFLCKRGIWLTCLFEKNVTNNVHGIQLLNNSHSSSFPLLHLFKRLCKFQANLSRQNSLFSLFSVYPPYIRLSFTPLEITFGWHQVNYVMCIHKQRKEKSTLKPARRLSYARGGFDSLASLKKNITNNVHGIQSLSNSHSSSFPLLHLFKKIVQIPSQSFWTK